MSSVTSLAGYNGTGVQGVAVTDHIDDNTRSVFWNENNTNRALVYGSALVEAPGGGDDNLGNVKTWVLDSTPDIIGDLFLRIRVNSTNAPSTHNNTCQLGMLNLINRIDIKVGNQIWQSMNRETLYNLLSTELNSEQFRGVCSTLSGFNNAYSDPVGGGIRISNENSSYEGISLPCEAFIPLLAFTKNYTGTKTPFNSINENGHLYCAAPDQQFTVQLFLSDGKSHHLTNNDSQLPLQKTNSFLSKYDTTDITTNLYYRQITMSNIERNSIINVPTGIPLRIKLTQEITDINVNSDRVRIDCSRFNLFASHLIVNMPVKNTDYRAWYITGDQHKIDFELHINGTSLFGVMPGSAFINGVPGYFLGLHDHRTSLTGIDLASAPAAMSGSDVAQTNWKYIIPLSSTAYGGSSLPLNRFDSIILTITNFQEGSSGYNNFVTNGATVTCVGESVALYKNSAASISSY